MNKKYIITSINNIICGFSFIDGVVQEIRAYELESILGNIYVGRVSNIIQNINSAFVDIKKGLSCYMSMEDYTGKKLKIGDLVTVQLSKEAIKTKAPTVTTRLSLDGEYVVVTVDGKIGVSSKIKSESKRIELKDIIKTAIDEFKQNKKSENVDFGIIVRTKSGDANINEIKEETINLLCKLDDIINSSKYQTCYSCVYEKCPMIIKDINSFITDEYEIITDLSEVISICDSNYINKITKYNADNISLDTLYGLKNIINKTLNKRVYLKSGAYIIIDHTEAMTVIDVNSGKAIKGASKEEKVLAINIEAAKEIVNQLILRDISGIIIIDFISMEKEISQNQLLKEFKQFAEADKTKTTVVDITRLGLVEVTRKRIRKPLHEIMK
ncbi:MAG: ribonuclease E/G [Lachnospiraceae bacterium]|nr:ribonuclease E/G [Lachnospiraceae bacterium]